MENLTYSYAASLKQRINCWQKQYSATEDCQNFKKHKERYSHLVPEDYEKMFRMNRLDEKQFDIGLSSLNEEKAALLFHEVKEEAWFSLHQSLFSSVEQPIKTRNLQSALRYHVAYYEKWMTQSLKKYATRLVITPSALKDSVEQFQEELFFLARKTLVWDVHQITEQESFKGLTKEEEFKKYILDYLGTKECVHNFFSAYPVLAKLLAIRLQFACDNFDMFIDGIMSSAKQLSNQFAVAQPFLIDQLNVGKGDSHQKGKTVIEFRLNDLPLFFKPKNLEMGNRFNALLRFLEETISGADFYKVNRIVGPTYSIEEKVMHAACTTKTEVEQFYSRYGQLMAVAYWLGSTDLHMENVIACGSYPVLIDIETIIRPKFLAEKKPQTTQQIIERNSVLASGLVPYKKQENKSVAIDALSGQKQKLPYKIRQLRQANSSEICFELADGHMEGAQNIPILNGKEVDYRAYRTFIISGFNSMNEELLVHKEIFLQRAEALFANVPVRMIFRDTQDYAEYLMFAAHPECMSNYIERERVIGNLWQAEFVPERLILEEVKAMLVNDIPLFLLNSSETSIPVAGKLVKVVEESPFDVMCRRIRMIDKQWIQHSLLLLKESLGLLHYTPVDFSISTSSVNDSHQSSVIKRAGEIGDHVVEQLLWDDTSQQFLGIKVTLNEEKQPIITYMDDNLYDGFGGIYLFLLTLNHYVPKAKYQDTLVQLEQQIFKRKPDQAFQGIFTGIGMRLLVHFFAAELLQDKQHEAALYENLCTLSEQELPESSEWIGGTAGVYTLLCEIYKVYPYPIIKKLLHGYADAFVLEKNLDYSFAHGYAGILYSLEKMDEVLQCKMLDKKIDQCKFMLLNVLEKEGIHNRSWCRGLAGVTHVLNVDNLKSKIRSLNANQLDDCLCHGQAGILTTEELLCSSLVQTNHVHLTSDAACLPLDLFTGASGIGYRLLQADRHLEVRSILHLNFDEQYEKTTLL
ncbi:type 2 lanthipeptide synthetase LanM [Candidatus Enterococcus clewellii]|uniref:Lantibiotic biosynthesis protein dehydration domain-containing protein n=1 Tax=Candidatus Enterococcus clewellii TaxID=1834193 RepID=A0A242K3I6_9ENTE|nr:type 2 lanthipeptide synthetase LanM [Enterococcus sp. 9E7_DIV0242]OTP13556.1 hypothetical protein A5888_003034 [Enterococcus sp. 9E7_DIV0242]